MSFGAGSQAGLSARSLSTTVYYCATSLDGYIAEPDDSLDASVSEIYADIAATAGDGALWVVGGGNVASQFADEGVLDEVHVTVIPVALGAGKPLFDRRIPGGALRLSGTRTCRARPRVRLLQAACTTRRATRARPEGRRQHRG